MRFDPLRGAFVSLLIAAASLVWFVAIRMADEALFRRLGYAMHAATLLAIFALIAGLAVAALFLRFHHVRTELLQGRRVVARWRVDAATFKAFAPRALDSDRSEKRQALAAVAAFVVVIFGAFALFDREAAPYMLSMAAVVILAMALSSLAEASPVLAGILSLHLEIVASVGLDRNFGEAGLGTS